MTSKFVHSMTWYAMVFMHLVTTTIMVWALAAAVLSQPSENRPAGAAGFYAPVIALAVAWTVSLDGTGFGNRFLQIFRRIMIVAGATASALLWLASEMEHHPAELAFWQGLTSLWLIAIGISIGLLVFVYYIRRDLSKPDTCYWVQTDKDARRVQVHLASCQTLIRQDPKSSPHNVVWQGPFEDPDDAVRLAVLAETHEGALCKKCLDGWSIDTNEFKLFREFSFMRLNLRIQRRKPRRWIH